MPHFLCEEMQEYIGMLYEISEDERMVLSLLGPAHQHPRCIGMAKEIQTFGFYSLSKLK